MALRKLDVHQAFTTFSFIFLIIAPSSMSVFFQPMSSVWFSGHFSPQDSHFWDSAALSDVPGLSNVPSLSGAHGLAEVLYNVMSKCSPG